MRIWVQLRAHTTCWPQPSSPRPVPSLLTAVALFLLLTGTWVCQTRQIKSTIDLPQLLVLQVTVKTEWVEYKVCLASLLLIVVSFLRERALLVSWEGQVSRTVLSCPAKGQPLLCCNEAAGLPHVGTGCCGLCHPSGSSQGLE